MATKTNAKPTRTEATTSWTDDELAAMKDHAKELKAAKRGSADGEADALAKIAEMSGTDKAIAERLHEIVKEHAPELTPRTYYGMPAYAKDGKVLCFFQPAAKFKARYATLGFDDKATLDDGQMWPTSWAIVELTPAVERTIVELIRKAVG
jgi:uncharacterized protein YdhG (YjbR/CyaY superfamily)